MAAELSLLESATSDLGALMAGGLPEHRAVLHAVILEDEDVDARVLERMLDQAWPLAVEVTRFLRLAELEVGLADIEADVVFCDLTVPDACGVEVVERSVRAAGTAPVVVLTGNADPSVPILALETGAQDYLSKGSFDVELLARTLRYSMARSQADQKLRRIASDLNALNDELEQYAGIVAHDLRAPLRTGRLFADRLVAATRRGDDGAALADALDASLGRMELMIDRLLQISTLREEAIEPVEEPLSLAVRDVQADLLADLREVGAELRVESDGAVLADRVLLRELLRNLVQNSIKYASPDRDPVITVSAEAVGSVTVVAVRDNGVGIAPEYRERVFRLFERLDDAPGVEGLGFGLACCRRIIELHRGSIALADPPGGTGLEVRLTLPTRKGGSGSVQLS